MAHDSVATSATLFEDVGKQVEGMKTTQSDALEGSSAVAGVSLSKEPSEPMPVDEIESLCMNCGKDGITRLLLTRIPFFREIVIMSFYCPHCYFKNSEVQSAGEIQERGSRYSLKLSRKKDLSRQVVKSDTGVATFEELGLEIPAGRGQMTNVEGLLSMAVEDLEFGQPARKSLQPEVYEKMESLLAQAHEILSGKKFPFHFSIDDPAGNSWIEPSPQNNQLEWVRTDYARTAAQNEALSLSNTNKDESEQAAKAVVPQLQRSIEDKAWQSDIVPDEVYSFPASCPGCTRSGMTHMKMVEIPHFREVVIMSTVCDHCGYKSNEVKTGGAVPSKGRRITLKVEKAEDLSRDILKSESCVLSCPEVGLHVSSGTLGGRFTTVEGLLTQVRDDLHSQIFDTDADEAVGGDSLVPESKMTWNKFFAGMDEAIKVKRYFTIILEDPMASSYVQNLCAPDADPQLVIEDYDRTEEEEEELGLNDMKTETYSSEQDAAPATGGGG